jgi:hypothetical protein
MQTARLSKAWNWAFMGNKGNQVSLQRVTGRQMPVSVLHSLV